MADSYDLFGEDMFDSEDVFDAESVYQLPIEIVLHLKSKQEPLFAEHVFFFDKEDPITGLEDLMNFVATWWSAIIEDKNIDFIVLTDRLSNKKAILIGDVVAVSFMTPEKPDWMNDEQIGRNPD